MSETFLNTIFDAKRKRVEEARRNCDIAGLIARAAAFRIGSEKHRLRNAISNDGINIIAEIKRSSPSKGVINDNIDVAETARNYENGGAAAISVLTEEDFFQGSLDDLRAARNASSLPILRKDFVFDEFQIYEAAEAGADAILLIVAMLDEKVLTELFRLAERELGLDALVEVHTLSELERAARIGAKLIGVNNRDLNSFDVSLDVSRELVKHKPDSILMITESGITSRDEIVELRSLGFDGFLIGETLMRAGDPENELRTLATEDTE
jgi:indole-3-glycerol phosphate synthase